MSCVCPDQMDKLRINLRSHGEFTAICACFLFFQPTLCDFQAYLHPSISLSPPSNQPISSHQSACLSHLKSAWITPCQPDHRQAIAERSFKPSLGYRRTKYWVSSNQVLDGAEPSIGSTIPKSWFVSIQYLVRRYPRLALSDVSAGCFRLTGYRHSIQRQTSLFQRADAIQFTG